MGGIKENKDKGALQMWKSALCTGPGHDIPGSSSWGSRAFGKGRKHWDAVESLCLALSAAALFPHHTLRSSFPSLPSRNLSAIINF